MSPESTSTRPGAAAEVPMPELSESMQDGLILSWLKRTGDWVARGEDLLEIETDKATMTYASESEGYLEITADAGETVAVGTRIARLWPERDAALSEEEPDGNGAGPDEAAKRQPDAEPPTPESGAEPDGPPAPTPRPAAAQAEPQPGDRRASPLARRIAARNDIDLGEVEGSGPGGRVTRVDVEALLGIRTPPSQAGLATNGERDASELPEGAWLEEPSRMQRRIADRMLESKLTAPDFGLLLDVDMGAALELRSELADEADADAATPSLNDLIVKAAARALVEFPRANGAFRDGRFELHEHVNVGFAVAVDQGLVVPVIRDADRKGLGEIATESRRLAERAREGTIEAGAFEGGTFTVSNLGMYGMKAILPVINTGEAAILGVGALERRVVAVDDTPTVRPQMSLSLICDHRILYGAEAARFLVRVRSLLERPLLMAL